MKEDKVRGFLKLSLWVLFCAAFVTFLLSAGGPDFFRAQRHFSDCVDVSDQAEIQTLPDGGNRISVQVPELREEGETAFVFVAHQFAELRLDDRLVAACEMPSERRVGKTPGCYWLAVPLQTADSGKLMSVDVKPVYREMKIRKANIFFSSVPELLRTLVRQNIGELFLCQICILIGLLLLLVVSFMKIGVKEKRQLWHLGAFSLWIGIWRACDEPIIALLLPRYTVQLSYLAVLGLIQMPAFFFNFLRARETEKYGRLFRFLRALFQAEAALFIIAHFTGLADLRQSVPCVLLSVAAAGLPLLVLAVINLFKREGDADSLLYRYFYIAFSVAAILDVLRYLYHGDSRYLPFVLCVTVLHLAVMCVKITKRVLTQRQEMLQIEAELDRERTRVMLSQIKPHFLFNSLSVIRELCRIDPAKAEGAVVQFSQYLRQNMESLRQDTPIPFSQELQHTKNYLALEQLRFGDALEVEYDIQASDFMLPTLTLQPIVENAVRHGIRKSVNGKTVRISTRELDDRYEIVVFNDGASFDPDKLPEDGKDHVGISNVRNRLKMLQNGSMKIESSEMDGTHVTMIIPKKE